MGFREIFQSGKGFHVEKSLKITKLDDVRTARLIRLQTYNTPCTSLCYVSIQLLSTERIN
jgi:hypothetical protein